MLQHVIATAHQLGADKIHTVIGHGAMQVKERIEDDAIHWVEQTERLGTGHAVAQVLDDLPDDARVLVLYGDVPLIHERTLETLVNHITPDSLGLLTVPMDDPTGYGRIVRDDQDRVTSIVEQKDANDDQKRIREVNTGILGVMSSQLKTWLPRLSNDNAQGEYYLTDIIAMAANDEIAVVVNQPHDLHEVQGVNNRVQLAELERWFQRHQAERLMLDGVTLADPERIDVRGNLRVGTDVFIDINVVFEGDVTIGNNVHIGPGCVVKDAQVGDGTEIKAYSVIESSVIGENGQIGPYARFRPGNQLAANAKVGNFVELKKAVVGEGSKINHLSYVGDATLGKRVNVGAGTITCNYDGANKYQTVIGDGVFVGSNSSLVAPVTIAPEATIGAGSTITRDVADSELAVARGRQRNISGWEKPKKH